MNKHKLTLNSQTEIDLFRAPIFNELDDVDLVVENDKLYITWPDFDRVAMIEDNAGQKIPSDLSVLTPMERNEWDYQTTYVDAAIAYLHINVSDGSANLEDLSDDYISIPYTFKVKGKTYEVSVGYTVLWG